MGEREAVESEHVHDVSCAFGNPTCPAFGEGRTDDRRPAPRVRDYAPWHCWSQGHGWLRCLWREVRTRPAQPGASS